MTEHYIVTLDHAHLRIYEERHPVGQHHPALTEVVAMDFPAGKQSYTDRDSDMAGRFPTSKSQGLGPSAPAGARTGMSIDERLPMQREESRRRAAELAAEVDRFFQQRPGARWDFAAGPDLNNAVLAMISPGVRDRLRRTLAKGLVKQPAEELRAHFAAS